MKFKALAAVLAGVVAGSVMGQGTAVYAPVKKIDEQGISLMGWGSGTISETDEMKFEGSWSLRVTTRNLFQGGLIRFAKPVDLSSDFADKSNLLRVTIRVPESAVKITPGAPGKPGGAGADGAAGGAAGSAGAGAGAGPGRMGQGPGGQGAPGQGGRPGAGASSSDLPDLTEVRFIVTTTDGKKSEVYVPVNTSASAEGGWKNIAIPLTAINGFDRTNKIIKEIAISGDTLATMYIGEMRVYSDTTPITGDVNSGDLNLALGDEREFQARGWGGASVLKYTWDFDAKDGIQVDAEGPVVKKKFRKPGDFTVTLTITDQAGLKKPYTKTFKVTVNP